MHRYRQLTTLKQRLRTLSSAYGVYEALSWLAALISSTAAALAELFA
ncbi:hypothetical protein SAMN05421853_11442 [Roseivivax halotolerans]|uniref:Uncharacterized protein n=1 Tax=Roseivivax halotolerans TaxID=93684 RepID=A0A1I6A267_9RHOB|nr:hypothetical protein [Roseivivax halotolerans]SFQ62762.1 hypothetical protein SAMN05421853_11442 [Roseivivax halotolerans]